MENTLETLLLQTNISKCFNFDDLVTGLKSIVFLKIIDGHDSFRDWQQVRHNEWRVELIDFPPITITEKMNILSITIIFEVDVASIIEMKVIKEFSQKLANKGIYDVLSAMRKNTNGEWRIEIFPVYKLVEFYIIFEEAYMKTPIFWW